MSSVGQIIEREASKSDSPSGGKDKKPQEWTTMQLRTVKESGHRITSVLLSRKGGVFGLSLVNENGFNTKLTGNAEEIEGLREKFIAEVNACFDTVKEESERFQKAKAEREARNGGGHGPVQVRSTGKTERERQKKLNRVKG